MLPDQVCVAHITYVVHWEGFAYLAVIIRGGCGLWVICKYASVSFAKYSMKR